MRRITCIAAILLLCTSVFAQDLRSSCTKFNAFNTEVLNGKIKKKESVKQFDKLFIEIKQALITQNIALPEKVWVFPLQGYSYHAIGGINGNGYSDKGYDYLDGNKHAAHPAQDIFISDKNQDCIDDKTHQPVNVLAVEFGVVIACTDDWDPKGALRGGKYIWIYHPQLNIITYYAHNGALFVKPGDVVKQGQKIAEVGRTGYNAYKKRSPTHLHFSAFHLVDGLPVPYNSYSQLKTASTL